MSDRRRKEDTNLSEDDPYAQVAKESSNVLESDAKESSRMKKWRQFKQKLEMTKGTMYQSFLMGAMVGGGFGLVIGIWSAISYRSFLIIPISTITSAASFGFFLACGSLIRSHPYSALNPQLNMITYNYNTEQIEQDVAIWKLKYLSRGF
jgi:hypothetical protein